MRGTCHSTRGWVAGDEGATATEYAILVGFLALTLVVGAALLAVALNGAYRDMGVVIGGWPAL